MAVETQKAPSSNKPVDARVAARKATKEAERKARGGRDLTPSERLAIRNLNGAAAAIDASIKSIKQGQGLSPGITRIAALFAADCLTEPVTQA
jgi:hypothetical protein